jgi:hypothetical protein
MSGYQGPIAEHETPYDGPACPACDVPYAMHGGLVLTCQENQRLRAALAAAERDRQQAERERDQLIEAWPMKLDDVDRRIEYLWPKFATRADAVRAAAALPGEGEGR